MPAFTRSASFEQLQAAPSAAAQIFLRIEGDDAVAAFPDAFAPGIAAEADSVAQSPDADQFL